MLLVAATIAAASAQPAPAIASFDVNEYRVEGNTLLPATDIEAAVYDFLGPGKTAADVERARAALEALYNSHGYPTVSAAIPRQSIADGVVVLQVVERKVGRLRVTGSKFSSLEAIRNGAPSVAEGSVPNVNNVQRDMVALNQQPARTVTPVLRAGRAPDTVDVDLQVQDHLPLRASLELDNRSSADTKPLRLSGSLGYDNLWQRGDSASLYFQVAPQRPADATVYSGSYLFQIPASKLALLGSYLKSDSNVSTVGGTTVIGKGQIAGLRLLLPLPMDAGFNQSFSAGMDYKDFTQNLLVGGATSNVPLTYYPVTASYQANWNSAGAQTGLTATAVFGTRGLGSDTAAFEANRAFAQPDFFYLRAAATHLHDLPYGMPQAWAHMQAQATPDPLVPNEQFGLGGLDTVRGYQESEVLGDNAASLQLELRSPSLADRIGVPLNELRFHAFSDLGAVSINQPLPEQRRSYSLQSIGAGLRMRVYDHFNGSLEDAVALATGSSTKSGTNRVLFRIYGDF